MRLNRQRFVGVLGWPLRRSLSPPIHAAAFKDAGLDWIYLSFPVAPAHLGAAVGGLRALGAAGANVTMPHKSSVMEFLDALEPEAEDLGAVNTIHNDGGLLTGHNTDVTGFRDFVIEDAGLDVAGRAVLVLGAGGAARAVVKALAQLGATTTVAGRDPDRTAEVAALGGGAGVPWDDAGSVAVESDIIVNATPLGMDGSSDPLPDTELRPDQAVIDIVTSPPTTPLMARARAGGADAWGGVGMLVRQAADSFRIWTGREASLEVMSVAAVRAIGHRVE